MVVLDLQNLSKIDTNRTQTVISRWTSRWSLNVPNWDLKNCQFLGPKIKGSQSRVDYTGQHWSTPEHTGVHWNTLEHTGVHWSTLEYTGAH